MPVTRRTAFIIGSRDDIQVTSAGPAENGKYVGWITLGEEDRYRPLLDSGPMYDSPVEAEEAMRGVVQEIRKAVQEECKGRDPLAVLLESAMNPPPEEGK